MGLNEDQTKQIKRQIKFYFSNSNIMVDKFLLEKVKENAEGWVELACLTTFNKVKQISEDVPAIAEALVGVEGIVVSDDKTKVRRVEPLPEKWDPLPRTVYAKGVPEDDTHEVLTEFFEKFGPVAKVMKRNWMGKGPNGERRFKPSCYVEFEKDEDAKKFLETEVEYNSVKLQTMSKEAHMAESAEKRAQGKSEKDGKRKLDDDEGSPAAKRVKCSVELAPNASIKFTEVGEIEWKLVKDAIKETSDVRFCVIENGSALVMFSSQEARDKVVAQNKEAAYKFGEVSPKECIALEGEEEEKFRKEMETKINELQANKGGKKGGKGGKGKKGGKKGGKGSKGKGRK